jgi:hypothetical protein
MTIVMRGLGISPGFGADAESYVYRPESGGAASLQPQPGATGQTDRLVPDRTTGASLKPKPRTAGEE